MECLDVQIVLTAPESCPTRWTWTTSVAVNEPRQVILTPTSVATMVSIPYAFGATTTNYIVGAILLPWIAFNLNYEPRLSRLLLEMLRYYSLTDSPLLGLRRSHRAPSYKTILHQQRLPSVLYHGLHHPCLLSPLCVSHRRRYSNSDWLPLNGYCSLWRLFY